jgi:hypothetical protein
MQGMQSVEVDIYRHAGRTADSGYHHHIVAIQVQRSYRPYHGAQNYAVATACAPHMGKFFIVPQILMHYFLRYGCHISLPP